MAENVESFMFERLLLTCFVSRRVLI